MNNNDAAAALNLNADQAAAMRAQILGEFRGFREQLLAAMSTPAANQWVLYFHTAGLGMNLDAENPHVCGVLFASVVNPDGYPTVRNGAGERARLTIRREAIEITLANLEKSIAAIEAVDGK